jgi:myo-inositol-1(or 4)-monophosphatase
MDKELLCKEVCDLSKEVGAFIRKERLAFSSDKVEVKSSNSFVSYVDKEAEQQIVKRLKELLPESGFIAEEGTETYIAPEYNWIVDPLDGTTNFIHNINCYAVSIALKRNDDIIIGVVYEINQDECFYAWEGSKAYLNGNEIHVSKHTALDQTLIATGFPYYDYERAQDYLKFLGFLMEKTRGIRRLGSAATDLAYVAAGRFDAFFEYGLNSWDVAAGALIVQQAGGVVNDFSRGSDYVFGREIVASNRGIAIDFNKGVQEYFVD